MDVSYLHTSNSLFYVSQDIKPLCLEAVSGCLQRVAGGGAHSPDLMARPRHPGLAPELAAHLGRFLTKMDPGLFVTRLDPVPVSATIYAF